MSEEASYLISCVIIIIIVLIVLWYDYAQKKTFALREQMRKLWLDEILWMKLYTNRIIENRDPEAENSALERLTKNHFMLGDLIYKQGSRDFINEMNLFSALYGKLVKETLNNEKDKAKKTWQMMLSTMQDISEELACYKKLCKKRMGKLLHTYSQNISQIFITQISRDWQKNNYAVDNAMSHASKIADYITSRDFEM